jgi:hypothetical protein
MKFRTDEQFSQGISSVSVTQTDAATVRVTVTGHEALPTGDVTLRVGEFGVKPQAFIG